MTQQTILRVEVPLGEGAYAVTPWDMCESSPRRPIPSNDGMGYISDPSLFFGFSSVEQLANWWTKSDLQWRYLREHEQVQISVYESCDYIPGTRQIAFRRDVARYIGSFGLDHFDYYCRGNVHES